MPAEAQRIEYPERLTGPQMLRVDHLVGATQLASSASEVRRLILQGGICIDDVRVEDPYQSREVRPGRRTRDPEGTPRVPGAPFPLP